MELAMRMLAAMVANTSVTRTLALALRSIGSLELLAQHLGVSEEQLSDWLAGRRPPPTAVYVRALDLVASGPFARTSRGRTDGRKR
jgi:hypothetical protein